MLRSDLAYINAVTEVLLGWRFIRNELLSGVDWPFNVYFSEYIGLDLYSTRIDWTTSFIKTNQKTRADYNSTDKTCVHRISYMKWMINMKHVKREWTITFVNVTGWFIYILVTTRGRLCTLRAHRTYLWRLHYSSYGPRKCNGSVSTG